MFLPCSPTPSTLMPSWALLAWIQTVRKALNNSTLMPQWKISQQTQHQPSSLPNQLQLKTMQPLWIKTCSTSCDRLIS